MAISLQNLASIAVASGLKILDVIISDSFRYIGTYYVYWNHQYFALSTGV